MPTRYFSKLISGGQTGADRAALDWALAQKIPHGGWCPRGRKAVDGPLPGRYLLEETPSRNYRERTEWNVRDSDATVVFTLAPEATQGSLKTLRYAESYGRPMLHFHPGLDVEVLRAFLLASRPTALNVAGSREQKEPGIYAWVISVLEALVSHGSSLQQELPMDGKNDVQADTGLA